MFKPTLSLGSAGPVVKELQNLLNQLPTALPRLDPDGAFGPKTRGRVVEFQGQNQLSQDGVVGPMTWEKLLALINQYGTGIVQAIIGPEDGAAARETIAKVALEQLAAFGNYQPPPGPFNPRIAGAVLADRFTRARQGGMQLMAIFSVAGVPSASKCPTMSAEAEQMYASGTYSAEDRNLKDIPSWCGIFALYCCKMAGLKLSSWPLRWTPGKPKATDEFRVLAPSEPPKKGDIGIKMMVDGRRLNHHFVIVETDGNAIKSVDGNAGGIQMILSKNYTKGEIYASQGGFLRPIWERVL